MFPQLAVAIKEKNLRLSELKVAASRLIESKLGKKLLRNLLKYLAYEYDPQFVRDLWKESKCEWKDFLNDEDPKEFIRENVCTNKFRFFFTINLKYSLNNNK